MLDFASVENKILSINKNADNIFLNLPEGTSIHTIKFNDNSDIPEGHTIFLTNVGPHVIFESSGGNFDFGVYFNPMIQTRRTHVFIYTSTGWVYS